MRFHLRRALLLPLMLWPTLTLGATVSQHAIRIHLDPDAHTLNAVDSLHLDAAVASLEFELHEALNPKSKDPAVTLTELEAEPDSGLRRWQISSTGDATSDLWVITYDGTLYQDVEGTVFGRERVGAEIRATIGDAGVYLAGGLGWYPQVAYGLKAHRVTCVLPEGWTCLTQGRRLLDRTFAGRHEATWDAPLPTEGINLVANRFRVDALQHGETLVETYFFPEDSSLAAGYLESCAEYLDLYESFLGPYPYAKFAVVENFFPTGYGMPSWTLLGQQVLRLPFIRATSLGHEIAHNWWGNSVFVGEGGNWCEGLTVYTADYLYKERASAAAARQYRKNTLKDYTRYTRDGGDFPLSEFVSRHNSATRAVGYGKSMFVFHMLEEQVGRPAFRAALRRVIAEKQWDEAVWTDFFRAVEVEGGLSDGALEDKRVQWIERAGAAVLELGELSVERAGEKWRLRGELIQATDPLQLRVPLRIEGGSASAEFLVETAVAAKPFELLTDFAPEVLRVDPDYHVFRRLHEEEMEATLSLIMAEADPLFLLQPGLDAELAEAFRDFAAGFVEGEPRVLAPGEDKAAETAAQTLIWLGKTPPPFREKPAGLQTTPFFTVFQEQRFEPGKHSLVYTGKRGEAGGFMAVLAAAPKEVREITRRVPHYGKYSYLGFATGRIQLKGNWEAAAGPLVRELKDLANGR
jgi:aminopeptidase N